MKQTIIGIYKITNKMNQKCYVGSSINISERWRRHKKDLRKSKHHSRILQRAWDKYGEESFLFEVLEECGKTDLLDRENYYLVKLEPVYNICRSAYSCLGVIQTEETKQRRREYALANNIRPPKETYEQRYIAVVRLDKETGEEIETYKSLSEACFSIGKDYNFVSTIGAVCRGKRKSAFGFKWKFKDY